MKNMSWFLIYITECKFVFVSPPCNKVVEVQNGNVF
jgi:hypothetical protein